MIIIILILSGLVIALSMILWNQLFYGEDKIRIAVISYYMKNYSRYRKDEQWSDVILDYCHDNKKNVQRVAQAFDKRFINKKTQLIIMP
jgi:hypothetical protein